MRDTPAERQLLDLTPYAKRDAALQLARRGSPQRYTAVARQHMEHAEGLTSTAMLFGSFVARMRGLHEG